MVLPSLLISFKGMAWIGPIVRATFFTRPTQSRRDAPFPSEHRQTELVRPEALSLILATG